MVDVLFCVKLRSVEDVDEVERRFIERAGHRGYEVKFEYPLPTSANIDEEEFKRFGRYKTYIWLNHRDFSEPLPFDLHYVARGENKRAISVIWLIAACSELVIEEIIYKDRIDRFLDDLKYMFDGEKSSYEVEGYGGCVDDPDYGYYD